MKLLINILFNCIVISAFGQFNTKVNIYNGPGSGSVFPYFWSSGDITGDGIKDAIAAHHWQGGDLIWSKGLGNGEYEEQPGFIFPNIFTNVKATAIADLNGDGIGDVIVANGSGGDWAEIFIMISNGNGNFQTPFLIGAVYNGKHISTGDIDGNGLIDIAVSRQYSAPILLYQISANNFVEQTLAVQPQSSGGFLELKDVDADGDLDFIYGGYNNFNIMINNGIGVFNESIHLEVPSLNNNLGLAADFDNDGDYDVVMGNTLSGLSYFRNDGGVLTEVADAFPFDNNVNYQDLIHADFNADGFMDIAVGCWSTACRLTIFFGNGEDSFAPLVICSGSNLQGNNLIADDFDDDGLIDIGMNNGLYYDLWYYKNDLRFCGDETACNYNENYLGPDINCCYGLCGCTDPTSADYNPAAICDDGSCGYSVIIRSFYDQNSNGVYNPGGNEYYIPNSTFQIQPGNYIVNTGVDAEAYISLPKGAYTATAIAAPGFDYTTTSSSITFYVNCNGISNPPRFGWNYVNTEVEGDVSLFPSANISLCDQVVSGNICAVNSGNQPREFVVNVSPNTLISSITFDNSVAVVEVGDSYEVSLGELIPGEVFCFEFTWVNPSVGNIGEFIGVDLTLNAIDDMNNSTEVANTAFATVLLCAYDPNDKLVSPAGEFEGNYVPIGTDLEYMLRFQNTGTAPASQVILLDTLSPVFDLSTIYILGNSHPFTLNINSISRQLTFTFSGINLPSSDVDEIGSHGFVAFKVKHNEDLNETTEVYNTGYIYFDNNPAIITNTTFTTLYECNNFFASFHSSDDDYCIGNELILFANVTTGTSYNWNINGNDQSNNNFIDISNLGLGTHTIVLNVNSPICDASFSQEITIEDCVTGIENTVEVVPFTIYPNPAKNEVTIRSNIGANVSGYSLWTIDGKLLKSETNVDSQMKVIDLSKYPAGGYILEVSSQSVNQVSVRKLLIIQ